MKILKEQIIVFVYMITEPTPSYLVKKGYVVVVVVYMIIEKKFL